MEHEIEVITHRTSNLKIFLVNMLYRTPHLHRDFEFGYVLENEVSVVTHGQTLHLKAGDFWMINPFQIHELKSDTSALCLTIQVPTSFFSSYYPDIKSLEFRENVLSNEIYPIIGNSIGPSFIKMALYYFNKPQFYELNCASLLNNCLFDLLSISKYRFIDEKEYATSKNKALRMRSILKFIDKNYMQKLLLSDIANQENRSLYYLSHLFKDFMGISFQSYLLKIRCEKARQLLLLTPYSLLDISISCGFSDPKYFNKGFLQQFGYTPKEYRKLFYQEEISIYQKSTLTSQKILSDTQSIEILENIMNNISKEKG